MLSLFRVGVTLASGMGNEAPNSAENNPESAVDGVSSTA